MMQALGFTPLSVEEIGSQIQRSWLRSTKAGLEKDCDPGFQILSEQFLMEKQVNFQLQKISQSMRSKYFRIMTDTKTRVCVCDADGFILDSWGCDEFLNAAEKIALLPGVNWREDTRGTNAIGTAIAEKKPALIQGKNHYLRSIRKVSCAGSPIMDGQGGLAGVIDLSGHAHSFRFENIYLAQMMAFEMENALLLNRYRKLDVLRLSWVFFPFAEGLIFLENDEIIAINKVASDMLRLTYPLGSVPIKSIIHEIDLCRDHREKATFIRPADGFSCYATYQRNGQPSQKPAAPVKRTATGRGVMDPQSQGLLAINRDIPLLVTGETGAGKEWFIRELHQLSNRRNGKLVVVNCCSLPDQLVESELFGYIGGAFTGANPKGAEGFIRQADGGILFLDEIADLSPHIQVKLLRVLQEKTVSPVGSAKTCKVDFRLICATHKNIDEEVRQGRFREDLRFRVNGFRINIPALRERPDFDSFVQQLLAKYGSGNQFSADLIRRMTAYAWPGNLRQLDHFIHIASAFAGDGDEITWEQLPDSLKYELTTDQISRGTKPEEENGANLSLEERLNNITLEVYRANGENVSKTARELGISRNTLYRRLRISGVITS